MSKYEVSYPKELPAEAFGDVWRIFRGGIATIKAEEETLGLALYNCQGFAQKKLVGDPEPVAVYGNAIPSEEDFLEACRQLSQSPFSQSTANNGLPVAQAIALPIPTKMLAAWLLIKLLELAMDRLGK